MDLLRRTMGSVLDAAWLRRQFTADAEVGWWSAVTRFAPLTKPEWPLVPAAAAAGPTGATLIHPAAAGRGATMTYHTRREFVGTLGAAVIGAHGIDLRSLASGGPAMSQGSPGRILELELVTSAALSAMKEFYGTALGLPIAAEGSRLVVTAGTSRLSFTRDPNAVDPFYHFAFNIPENQIVEARAWQLRRGPLLPIPDRLRDPRFPPDVVDYRHWNAHSIFFLDPGGNVVEYIARHDLRNASPRPFGPSAILCASEIGLIVDDVPATASRVRQATGFETYRGGSREFEAVGDEEGLLLVMKRGRILNFRPETQEKAARVYPTVVEIRSGGAALRIDGFPYEIRPRWTA